MAISGSHCRFVPTAGQTHTPCRGGDSRARRCTCARNRLSIKWQTPKACHCEGALHPWQSRGGTSRSYRVTIKRTDQLRLQRRSLCIRWRLCRLTDAACPLRIVSALQGGNTYGTNSLAQCHQVCHCEEAAGRRGNLAVPGQITGKPSAKTQLPSRDCTPRALPRASRSGRHGPFGASQ